MPKFTVGQQVTVSADSRAVVQVQVNGRKCREHLACSPGTVVAGGKPEAGLYAVRFALWGGNRVVTLDGRDLEPVAS